VIFSSTENYLHHPEFRRAAIACSAGIGTILPSARSSTLLQKALRRASKIAPIGQIAVTAAEEYREYREPASWFTSPANRFIADSRKLYRIAHPAMGRTLEQWFSARTEKQTAC
jgi:hypothetical protein